MKNHNIHELKIFYMNTSSPFSKFSLYYDFLMPFISTLFYLQPKKYLYYKTKKIFGRSTIFKK